jgi:tRNA pseudouridine55 synthase
MAGIHGILLLDKPLGLSSSQALARAKRLLGAHKAGHTGALDPLATGMLPCCFGEATKIAGSLLGARKAYRAQVALGATTATGDREGAVERVRAVPAIDAAALAAVLARFRGRIRQRPPAYSALKRDGVPLYRLARRGEVVEAPEREVEIFALGAPGQVAIAPFEPPAAALGRPPGADGLVWPGFELEVVCGSGTYIRSLAADIGEALGCGAHLAGLRRPWVEPFEDAALVTLEALEAAREAGRAADCLLPVAAGLRDWRRIDVDADGERRLRMGQVARIDPGTAPGTCRVHGPDGGLLALAAVEADGVLRVSRVFAPGV